MKKLLGLFAAFGMVATSSTAVIACDSKTEETQSIIDATIELGFEKETYDIKDLNLNIKGENLKIDFGISANKTMYNDFFNVEDPKIENGIVTGTIGVSENIQTFNKYVVTISTNKETKSFTLAVKQAKKITITSDDLKGLTTENDIVKTINDLISEKHEGVKIVKTTGYDIADYNIVTKKFTNGVEENYFVIEKTSKKIQASGFSQIKLTTETQEQK